jgi:hypothetical protein
MSAIENMFNQILSMHGRKMTLRRGNASIEVRLAPSNYMRNLAGPSGTEIEGREWVMTKKQLVAPLDTIKRSDTLKDADLSIGTMSVTEVQEMYDFGGAVIGYRIRTT